MAFVLGAGPAAAEATELRFTVSNIRDSSGQVRVALCPRDTFLSDDCPYSASAPAQEGSTEVVVSEVESGIYGIQAYHDANENSELDRNFVGYPQEGFAFGNDAPVFFRPPKFDDAAVAVGEDDLDLPMTMRYR